MRFCRIHLHQMAVWHLDPLHYSPTCHLLGLSQWTLVFQNHGLWNLLLLCEFSSSKTYIIRMFKPYVQVLTRSSVSRYLSLKTSVGTWQITCYKQIALNYHNLQPVATKAVALHQSWVTFTSKLPCHLVLSYIDLADLDVKVFKLFCSHQLLVLFLDVVTTWTTSYWKNWRMWEQCMLFMSWKLWFWLVSTGDFHNAPSLTVFYLLHNLVSIMIWLVAGVITSNRSIEKAVVQIYQ